VKLEVEDAKAEEDCCCCELENLGEGERDRSTVVLDFLEDAAIFFSLKKRKKKNGVFFFLFLLRDGFESLVWQT
jgi:hypothetical protein